MGKLTGKGKHAVKVENCPYTNMISKPVIMRKAEYKCRTLEMHLKLKDQQLKSIIYIYIYGLLYQTSWELQTKDSKIHTEKEKAIQTQHDSHQIIKENKR